MKDEHHGKGGTYEIRDGKRVLVRRAGMNIENTVKKEISNGAKVSEKTPPRKN